MGQSKLIKQISNCDICRGKIPEPNPVIQVHSNASILIIGQAPGRAVHETEIPWDDPSGKRLREWTGIESADFYNPEKVALMPMGFCYPGKGKSGDLPPRTECAPKWHGELLKNLPNIQCTLLIGQYAQNYYLKDSYPTLTERVQHWKEFAPKYYVLPHPSPRNQPWIKRNSWFEKELIPDLQNRIRSCIEVAK